MGVILMMMAIFLFMGALMDWVGIVLLAMPVFLPIVAKMAPSEMGLLGGIDPSYPVWFGILFCVNMQVSFLSPPFGPAAFWGRRPPPPTSSRGLPFICIRLLVLAIMLMFPEITSVFLPD